MKIHVLSAGAAKGLVDAVQPAFTAQTGAELDASFSAVGAIQDRFLAGEPCDVLILTAALLNRLAQRGEIATGAIWPLGRVATGIAVRAGAPAPRIATAEALRVALLRASTIYLPDPQRATGGIHFARVRRELGIHDEVAPRLRAFANGALAMSELARSADEDALGCTQVSEIRYTEGVTLVAPLPPPFELTTVYSLGVPARAIAPALARRLADMITAVDLAEIRGRSGFETV